MGSGNICKFPLSVFSSSILIAAFVLEKDQTIMRSPIKLSVNRALLVINGKGFITLEGNRVPYQAGSLIFGFIAEQFFCEPDTTTEYIYIDFDGSRSNELFKQFNVTQHTRCFAGFDGVIPMWLESISRANESTLSLIAESILLYTFSRITNEQVEQNALVKVMLKMTDDSFRDQSLSLSTLAAHLSYNPKYLSHLFKSATGMGYNEYLRNLRINFAVSLFDEGIESTKSVAHLSGFSDPAYFAVVFKKVIGLTPTEYKAK